MAEKEDGRTNTGIRIDKGLWTEFRIRSIREGFKMGELIEGWIRDYLKKHPPQKRKKLDL